MLDEQKLKTLYDLRVKYIDSCLICHGSGVPCSCHAMYLKYWNYLEANINPKYWDLTFENLKDQHIQVVKAHIQTYIANLNDNLQKGEGLFLWGTDTGNGKTTLGCVALKEALKCGKKAYFVTFSECIALEKEGWADQAKKEFFDEKFLDSDILLLDELGAEFKSSKSRELIEAMFNGWFRKRCDLLKSTIITTNVKKEDLEKEYGSRLFSIFSEHMQFLHIASETDYRQEIIAPQKPEVK